MDTLIKDQCGKSVPVGEQQAADFQGTTLFQSSII
jgi:hypothetical protein